MALSAPAKTQLGIAMANIAYAAEITTAVDALLPTSAQTFSGGVTITTVALTITDVNIVLSATTGTMLGNANTQKLGLWGATPVAQPSSTGELVGIIGNAATNTNATNMNSNGNVGATAYSFNDVVKALKQAGVLKS